MSGDGSRGGGRAGENSAGRDFRARHGGPVLGLVALGLALTGPALLGVAALGPESLLDGDPLYQKVARPPPLPPFLDLAAIGLVYPRDRAFALGLHAGRLDHWDPLAGTGVPLWAEQLGPFFPPKAIFHAFPSPGGYTLFLFVRLVAAGLGAYFFARARGSTAIGAFVTGALFQLSGIVVSRLAIGNMSAFFVLPWLMLAADALRAHGGPGAIAAAGLALGCAALGGHPGEALLVWVAFAVFVAAECLRHERGARPAAAIMARAAVAGVLGFAIAAPALLPLVAVRAVALAYKHAPAAALLRAEDLAASRALWPLGWFAPGVLVSLESFPQARLPSSLAPSIGVAGLALAAIGIAGRRVAAGLVAVLGLGLALAVAPPVVGWVRHLPGLNLIPASYAWALVAFPLAVAAGSGLDDVAASRPTRRMSFAVVAAILAGAAGTALWCWIVDTGADASASVTVAVRDALHTGAGALRFVAPLAAAATVVFAGRVLAAAGHARRAPALIAAVTVAEALATVAPYCWQPSSRVLREPPAPMVRALQEKLAAGDARFLALPKEVALPETPTLFGLRDFRLNSALPSRRYMAYLGTMGRGGTNTYLVPAGPRSGLLDLAAVRFVVLDNDARGPMAGRRAEIARDPLMRPLARTALVTLYENLAAVARVRLLHRAVAVASPDEARRRLAPAAAVPHAAAVSLDATVFVEPDASGRVAPDLGAGTGGEAGGDFERAPADATERATLVAGDDPDRLDIDVHAARPAVVVVADAYDAGWTATVDGVAAPLHPANLLFRAVFVPAGDHRIALEYSPRGFRVGAGLGVLGLLACGILVARSRAARRAGPGRA